MWVISKGFGHRELYGFAGLVRSDIRMYSLRGGYRWTEWVGGAAVGKRGVERLMRGWDGESQ